MQLSLLGKISTETRGHFNISETHKTGLGDILEDFDLKRKPAQLKQVLKRVIDGTFASFELIKLSFNL